MFRHAMGVQIMDNSIINYWRHVFIKASLFCEHLCHFVFGILTWLVTSSITLMIKGLRPVLEGFVVPMHEGACETGSQILRA